MATINPNFQKRAAHIAQSNHAATSPEGLLESILAIEAALKIKRPARLDVPAPKGKGKGAKVAAAETTETPE